MFSPYHQVEKSTIFPYILTQFSLLRKKLIATDTRRPVSAPGDNHPLGCPDFFVGPTESFTKPVKTTNLIYFL